MAQEHPETEYVTTTPVANSTHHLFTNDDASRADAGGSAANSLCGNIRSYGPFHPFPGEVSEDALCKSCLRSKRRRDSSGTGDEEGDT